ncbi:hypothetical protein EFY79_12915 [Hanamia caeni]|jgi:hypothetical protein|uniref:Uncharacterized protein n=1 Tax=Hanamia caeni TaxID=2294116 RepID=A0A3M9NC90_9BACT|nr:hypothetical protein EFY79_12915 [Hanamia caeni]
MVWLLSVTGKRPFLITANKNPSYSFVYYGYGWFYLNKGLICKNKPIIKNEEKVGVKNCRNQKLVYFYGVLRPLPDIIEKAALPH